VLRSEHGASEGKAEQWLRKEMDAQLDQLSGNDRHFVRLFQEEILTIKSLHRALMALSSTTRETIRHLLFSTFQL